MQNEAFHWTVTIINLSLIRVGLSYCRCRIHGPAPLGRLLWLMYYTTERKDVVALEGVENRSTRMLHGMESCSYKERSDRLDLFSLE